MRNKKRFFKGMLIYALVFLSVTAAGLAVFWNFIEAYEASRPKNTMDAYVSSLTPEDICRKAGDSGSRLQSREQWDAVIAGSLTEQVTYAKKSSESTADRQVYVLRCGRQIIGRAVISAQEPDRYGFTPWSVTEGSFDFSHLRGEPLQITVPEEFSVYANGQVLDGSYISERDIEYSALEEFYGDYQLPVMVTYTVDDYLGEMELSVKDPQGNPVTVTETTDWNTFLNNCAQDRQKRVEDFLQNFVKSYILFTGSSNRASVANYYNLRNHYLIPDSDLANRLYTALDGLAYAQSHGDKLVELTFHHVSAVSEERYFCDLTYVVSTYGRAGEVLTSNNMKLMLVETEDGLRVEAMTRY